MISLDKRQLTLLLGDGSYAGRFPIGMGREHPPAEGVYAVSDKVAQSGLSRPDRSIGGGDPANPLGDRWIGLGSELGIHGTNRPDSIGRTDLPGSISLSPRDVDDVYDILSVGSKVIDPPLALLERRRTMLAVHCRAMLRACRSLYRAAARSWYTLWAAAEHPRGT